MPANPASILDTVKKALGMDPEFTAFDLDVTMYINAAFGSLQQLGVGGDTGFVIADNTALWSQYVTSLSYLGMVKSFVFMSVRLAFDPPATSFGIDAFKSQLAELGWRICSAVEQENPPSSPFVHSSTTVMNGGVLSTYFAPKTISWPFSSSITIDAKKANVFDLVLTGDCTINSPINGADGEHITLRITAGGHTVTWGTGWDFGTPGTPTLTSGKSDIVSAVWKESDTKWWAGASPGF